MRPTTVGTGHGRSFGSEPGTGGITGLEWDDRCVEGGAARVTLWEDGRGNDPCIAAWPEGVGVGAGEREGSAAAVRAGARGHALPAGGAIVDVADDAIGKWRRDRHADTEKRAMAAYSPSGSAERDRRSRDVAMWAKAEDRWRVQIKAEGRSKYRGYVDDEWAAAEAYDAAARELHGEWAVLNFPSEGERQVSRPKRGRLADKRQLRHQATVEELPMGNKPKMMGAQRRCVKHRQRAPNQGPRKAVSVEGMREQAQMLAAAGKQQTRVSAARPDSRVRPPQQAEPVAAVGEEEADEKEEEAEGVMQSDEEPSQSQSEADDDTLSWLIEMLPPDLSFQDFSKQLRGFSEQVGGRGGCGCALCCAADVDVRCRRDCG